VTPPEPAAPTVRDRAAAAPPAGGLPPLRWTPLGDAAIAIRFAPGGRTEDGAAQGDGADRAAVAEGVDLDLLDRIRAAVALLDVDPLPGVDDVASTFTTVTLFFDPLRWSGESLAAAVLARLADGHEPRGAGAGPARLPAGRVVEVPVAYGGEHGPDLDDVAARTGLPADEVVRLHASADYRVAMVGFAPGFPYLVGLPAALAVPRLDVPRLRVPAGSVGIGGGQTGVYPLATPGGWRIIGRTPLAFFVPEREPPVIVAAGDVVRFRPVSAAECARLAERRP